MEMTLTLALLPYNLGKWHLKRKLSTEKPNSDICVVPEATVIDYAAFFFSVVPKLKDYAAFFFNITPKSS
jgi:hypothetical protein